MRQSVVLTALVGVLIVAGTGIDTAQAIPITGNLWHAPPSTSGNAIPANVPGPPADVQFNVNSPMNFSAISESVGTWLASSAAFNIIENTPGTLASPMGDFVDVGTLVEFTGLVSVATGDIITVTHDDGVTLIIGGTNLGFFPGPTPTLVEARPYFGSSGTFPFQLVYGEIGGAAVLKVALPLSNTPAVPEPSTVLLLASGLAGIFGYGWRRKGAA